MPNRGPVGRAADATPEAVGQVVRTRRIALGLRRTQLRDATSLSYSMVKMIEAGTTRAGEVSLQRIACALGCRPDDILDAAIAIDAQAAAS